MSDASEIDGLRAVVGREKAANAELAKLNAALVAKVETLEGLVLRLTEGNRSRPPLAGAISDATQSA